MNEYQTSNNSRENYDYLRNLSILISGLVCFFGTFSPWVTVSDTLNITGNRSEWGITTFIAFITYVLYSLSGLITSSRISNFNHQLRRVSIIVSSIVLVCLTYLLIRFLSAMSDYNKEIEKARNLIDDADTGFLGDAFGGLVDQFAEALEPQLGVGFIACYVSVMAGLALSIFVSNPFQSREDKVPNPLKVETLIKNDKSSFEVYNSQENQVARKKSFKILISLISLILLGLLVGLLAFKLGKDINKENASNSQEITRDINESQKERSEIVKIEPAPEPSKNEVNVNEGISLNKQEVSEKSKNKTKSEPNFEPLITAPTINKIDTAFKELFLNWSPVVDSKGDFVSKYYFRYKVSTTKVISKPYPCVFNPSEITFNANLRCAVPLGSLPDDSWDKLFTDQVKFNFSIQAASGEGFSAWGKDFEFDFASHPELLNR